MGLLRFLRHGFDAQTNDLVRGVLRHPLVSGYRLLRQLSRDDEQERRLLLRNLALGLPDRVAGAYARELDFLAGCGEEDYPLMPYAWRTDVSTSSVEAGIDDASGLPYVCHDGRRLYFPKPMSVEAVKRDYLYFTEDEGILGTGRRTVSPHAYVDADFRVEPDDVLVDIGCSDGLFAFHNAPVAKRLYLFEAWDRWLPGLKRSFAPYADKTRIFAKYVSSRDGGDEITLRHAVEEPEGTRYFLKMDIEGAERAVLEASADFLRRNKVKLSCCVYHRQDDAEVITRMLEGLGFRCRFSEGYMLPLFNGIRFPYFRHGVVYARNDD